MNIETLNDKIKKAEHAMNIAMSGVNDTTMSYCREVLYSLYDEKMALESK